MTTESERPDDFVSAVCDEVGIDSAPGVSTLQRARRCFAVVYGTGQADFHPDAEKLAATAPAKLG